MENTVGTIIFKPRHWGEFWTSPSTPMIKCGIRKDLQLDAPLASLGVLF